MYIYGPPVVRERDFLKRITRVFRVEPAATEDTQLTCETAARQARAYFLFYYFICILPIFGSFS